MPGGMSAVSTYGSYESSLPAYERVTSIPSWLPTERTRELEEQYRNTNTAYDTSAYDQANQAQQSRVLTTALNSGNAAAADYANRARQAGGSALGAGLVKAQAATGARATAGAMELDKQKFDAAQREAAATHATQIATTLGQLRDSYLRTIVDYATKTDSTNAGYTVEMRKLEQQREKERRLTSGGGYQTNRLGQVSNLYGNVLENNPLFNSTTGLLSFGGG